MPVKPLLAAFLVLPLLAGAADANDACAELAPDSPVVRLAGLDDAGDPVLVDGRRLRLVGLAPRQDDAEASRFSVGIGAWRDRDLKLVLLGGADRWGRLPARLYVPAGVADAAPRNWAKSCWTRVWPFPCRRGDPPVAAAKPAWRGRERSRPRPRLRHQPLRGQAPPSTVMISPCSRHKKGGSCCWRGASPRSASARNGPI